MNLCRACGKDFGSLGAFDKHRVGKIAYRYTIDQPGGRRCLHASELGEAGWSQDKHGRWRTASDGFTWKATT